MNKLVFLLVGWCLGYINQWDAARELIERPEISLRAYMGEGLRDCSNERDILREVTNNMRDKI